MNNRGKARIIFSLICILVVGLITPVACGPSEEELRRLEEEKVAKEWLAKRAPVEQWSKQVGAVVDAENKLRNWWAPIQADFNRQLSEGRTVTKVARERREDQLYTLLDEFGKIFAVANTIRYPDSCWKANQALLQYLNRQQARVKLMISYNSMGNERDRLEANAKQSEANTLYEQFTRQYLSIKQEWRVN